MTNKMNFWLYNSAKTKYLYINKDLYQIVKDLKRFTES